MAISDNVTAYILNLLRNDEGIAEIQRNELAGIIGCVPSQINYVITSRFTPEQGYIVESRRGGGGYIRIIRRSMTKDNMVMHIVNSIGERLSSASTDAMLNNMAENNIICNNTCKIISAAVSDHALSAAPKSCRDELRASIFKNILLAADE